MSPRKACLAICFLGPLLGVSCSRHESPAPSSPLPLLRKAEAAPAFQANAKVKTVFDGDTALLENGATVRYIGIDTPERDEPFSEEAKSLNARLVEGKEVRLEYDVENRDDYKRLLAYIFTLGDDGKEVFVNGALVREGVAVVYTIPPNTRHAETLLTLQRTARDQLRGLWGRPPPPESHYMASQRSHRFHRPSCDSAAEIFPKNLIRFETRNEALDTGRAPCRKCKP